MYASTSWTRWKNGMILASASMLFPYNCRRLLGSLGRGSWSPRTVSATCSFASWSAFTGICSTLWRSGSKAFLTRSWSVRANCFQCRRTKSYPKRKSSSVFSLWPVKSCSTLLTPSVFKSAALRCNMLKNLSTDSVSDTHRSRSHTSTCAVCCADKRCKYRLIKKHRKQTLDGIPCLCFAKYWPNPACFAASALPCVRG